MHIHRHTIVKLGAVAGLVAVLAKFLIAGTILHWSADRVFTFDKVEATVYLAILTPTFGALVTSLHDRFNQPNDGSVAKSAPPTKTDA